MDEPRTQPRSRRRHMTRDDVRALLDDVAKLGVDGGPLQLHEVDSVLSTAAERGCAS